MSSIKYYIIEDIDRKELEKRINQYLKEGWSLQGSIAVASSSFGQCLYLQAMTRTLSDDSKA